ncbi:hypothetical protein ACM66B_004591 [Microbotryomycetes sp. NB124-2]
MATSPLKDVVLDSEDDLSDGHQRARTNNSNRKDSRVNTTDDDSMPVTWTAGRGTVAQNTSNATASSSTSVAPTRRRSPPASPSTSLSQTEFGLSHAVTTTAPPKARRKKKTSQFVSAAEMLHRSIQPDTPRLEPERNKSPASPAARLEPVHLSDVRESPLQSAALKETQSVLIIDTSLDSVITLDDDDSDELQAPQQLRAGLKRFAYGSSNTMNAGSSSNPRSTVATLSKGKRAKKLTTTSMIEAPPLVLPPRAQVKLLDQCVVCRTPWTTNKTAQSKTTHLEKCARTHAYDSETMRVLVDNRIVELARTVEAARRQSELSQTMFDRVVGIGEGLNAMREVSVVGVEGCDLLGAAKAQIDELQNQLNKQRKRPPVSQVTEAAKRILKERSSNAEQQGSPATDPFATAGIGHRILRENDEPTGHRVNAVIAQCQGTGLTQAGGTQALDSALHPASQLAAPLPPPPRFAPPTTLEGNHVSEGEVVIIDDDSSLPLPATQQFAPSTVASLVSATSESDGASSSRSHMRTHSLWTAAGAGQAELDDDLNTSLSMSFNCSSPASSTHTAPNLEDLARDGNTRLSREIQVLSIDTSDEEEMQSVAASGEDARTVLSNSDVDTRRQEDSTSDFDREQGREGRSADASAAVTNAIEPDWTLLTVKQLQDKVAEYGFRRARVKKVLVQQMHDIWQAMANQGAAVEVDSGSAAPSSSRIGTVEAGLSRPAAGATLSEHIKSAVLEDSVLYQRILRYEPVHIDTFTTLVASRGIKVSRAKLIRFLDLECITFYSQDPTNGTRSRYR